MKKAILIAVALMAVFTVSADERSDKALKHISRTFAGYGSYEVKFTVNVKGSGSFSGNYIVSGDKYYISVQNTQQFSDGQTKYSVYGDDKEVVIDKEDKSSSNILNNPTRAFEFLPSEYSSVWRGEKNIGGKSADVIVLTPRVDKNSGVITLYIGKTNGMPIAVDYDYQGEKVSISIVKIVPMNSVSNSMFMFDKSKYKGYEVIDFR